MRRFTALLITMFILLSFPFLSLRADDFMDRSHALEFFKEGLDHFNHREYEAAVDFFRKSLGKAPDDARTRFYLGLAYFKAGYEDNALFEFDTLMRNPPDDFMLRNTVDQIIRYLNRKQFAQAKEKESGLYAVGLTLEGNPIGRYYLTRVTGIHIDAEGAIYAAGFGSKIALKISPQGDVLRAYKDPRLVQGRPYDIVRNSKGIVYISDFSNDRIHLFEDSGTYLSSIGSPGFGEGSFYGPTALAVDGDDNLYVIDSGNTRVQKFSENGEFLLTFGREGGDEGELLHPSGLAVDGAGRIYVADHAKKTIGMYDRSGNFISYLTGMELIDPYGISFHEEKLIVSDGPSIKTYDPVYSTWTRIQTGTTPIRVLDAHMDYLGRIVACDYSGNAIYRFVPQVDKYRNLSVILGGVDADSFPAVVYYTSVFDADGLPFYGLGQNNFFAKIGRGNVKKIDLSYNEIRDSKLNLLFLVDKSPVMETYAEDLEGFIRPFLEKTAGDELAVISFNENSWIASAFTGSKLRTLEAVIQKRYDEGKRFDSAFRRGIDYLNKRFYKKAVVVITDGSLDASSFSTYSFSSCYNYAANNHIPVYFVSFGEHDEQIDVFAQRTGGKVYNGLFSNDLPYLYETIRAYRSPEYVVLFNDVYDKTLSGKYLEAEIEVDLDGIIGRGLLGFVYP